MKFLVALVILCAAIGYSQQALSLAQKEEMAKNLMEECAKAEKATADEVANAIAHQPPKTKSEKCLHACIGETLGLIQDKKTNVESSAELAIMAFGADDPKVAHARDIATECANVSDDDRCEAAVKIYECSMEAAKKRSIGFNDFF